MQENIESKLSEIHNNDKTQLDIVFSNEARMVLEAPAGCGKTTTMVSRIAYLLAKGMVNRNKKVLALTFSVNAAYKIKKDVAEKLPQIGVCRVKAPSDVNSVAFISNYHGFCRRVLSVYGYLIDEKLKDINSLKTLSETDWNFNQYIADTGIELNDNEEEVIKKFGKAVLDCDYATISMNIAKYNSILANKMLPCGYITFNGFLTFTQELFQKEEALVKFYRKLYPVIIIDEFQDTNYLSWELIKRLVSPKTNLMFMGDPLQRIYGFIGAVPELMDIAEKEFQMTRKKFTRNYRFKDNPSMLALDQNIRRNAENCLSPIISENADIQVHLADTHEKECEWISSKVEELTSDGNNCAILVQQRGLDVDIIMRSLKEKGIDYFYALFSEDDNNYIEYHNICRQILQNEIVDSKHHRLNKGVLEKTLRKIKDYFNGNMSELITSLIVLTDAFFSRVINEYGFLEDEEKKIFVYDAFENRSLKQNMDLVDSNVFVSTVHGAKGLEWNSVLIPDLEPYCFPNYGSLCGGCNYQTGRTQTIEKCMINISNHDERRFLEELSVFYVAVTRAKKKLFFSASKSRYNNNGKRKTSKVSCLAFLPGIAAHKI